MDTKLKIALEQSEYMRTFQNQKHLLKEKFKKDCIVYYNGGMFVVNLNFINSIKNPVTDIVIDENNIPVKISNMQDFYETMVNKFRFATESYYDAYVELCKFKDAKGLLS